MELEAEVTEVALASAAESVTVDVAIEEDEKEDADEVESTDAADNADVIETTGAEEAIIAELGEAAAAETEEPSTVVTAELPEVPVEVDVTSAAEIEAVIEVVKVNVEVIVDVAVMTVTCGAPGASSTFATSGAFEMNTRVTIWLLFLSVVPLTSLSPNALMTEELLGLASVELKSSGLSPSRPT